MSEPVKIVITAQTAEAAAAIRQFAVSAGADIGGVAGAAAAPNLALRQLRETSMLTREGFMGLQSTALLLGGTHFPQLTYGVMGLTEGMRALRGTALLSKLSLGELVPIIAGIGLVLAGVVVAWDAFSNSEITAKKRTEDLAGALEKLPDLLKNISDAAQTGFLSPEKAEQLRKMASGETPLYYPRTPAGMKPGSPYYSKDPDGGKDKIFTGDLTTEASFRNRSGMVIQNEPALQKDKDAYLQRQAFGGTGDDAKLDAAQQKIALARIAAQKELDDLMRTSSQEQMGAFDKERSQEDERYGKELAHFKEVAAQRRAGITDQQQLAAITQQLDQDQQTLDNGHLARLDAIDQKQNKSNAEAQNKLKERAAQAFTKANTDLETQITTEAEAAGKKREEYYQEEYAERTQLAEIFYRTGAISEQQYNEAVAKAQQDFYAGRNAMEEEGVRKSQADQENRRADIEAQIAAIQSDQLLTRLQKEQEELVLKQQLLQLDQQRLAIIQQRVATTGDDQVRATYEKEIEELKKQIAVLQNQIPAGQRSMSVGGNVQDQWTQIQGRLGSPQENAANVITSPFAQLDTSLDKALSDMMIKGTSFRQFWQSISLGMAEDFARSVAKMAADEATSLAMQAAQWIAHNVFKVAIHTAGEQAQTAVTAQGSVERGAVRVAETLFHIGQVALRTAAHVAGEILQTSMTIAQSAIRVATILAEAIPYLIKAAIMAMDAMADIPIVGPVLAIAAAGAIIAAGAGLMSRDSGGPGEPGQVYHIGRGAQDEIFVPHNAGTFYPKGQWSANQAVAPGGGGGASSPDVKVDHFVVYNDQQLYEKMKSSTAKKIFVTHLSDPGIKTQAGIQT